MCVDEAWEIKPIADDADDLRVGPACSISPDILYRRSIGIFFDKVDDSCLVNSDNCVLAYLELGEGCAMDKGARVDRLGYRYRCGHDVDCRVKRNAGASWISYRA